MLPRTTTNKLLNKEEDAIRLTTRSKTSSKFSWQVPTKHGWQMRCHGLKVEILRCKPPIIGEASFTTRSNTLRFTGTPLRHKNRSWHYQSGAHYNDAIQAIVRRTNIGVIPKTQLRLWIHRFMLYITSHSYVSSHHVSCASQIASPPTSPPQYSYPLPDYKKAAINFLTHLTLLSRQRTTSSTFPANTPKSRLPPPHHSKGINPQTQTHLWRANYLTCWNTLDLFSFEFLSSSHSNIQLNICEGTIRMFNVTCVSGR